MIQITVDPNSVDIETIFSNDSKNKESGLTGFVDPQSITGLVQLANGKTRLFFENHTVVVYESLDWFKTKAPFLFY